MAVRLEPPHDRNRPNIARPDGARRRRERLFSRPRPAVVIRSGMPQLILHIGDGKCGSSSIQSSLRQAAPELERQFSMLYLTPNGRTSHFGIGTLLGERTRGDDSAIRAGLIDALAQIKARMQCGGIDHVIISDESLFCIPAEKTVDALRIAIGPFGSIHVVSYLREPAGMYLSLMQQRLKADNIVSRPENYRRAVDRYLCPWREAPMVASVRVRPFVRTAFRNGSVTSDFSDALEGISGLTGIELKDTEENQSLTAEQMILLQIVQNTFFREFRGKQTPEVSHLINFFRSLNRLGPIGTKPKLQERWETLIRKNASESFCRLIDFYPNISNLLPTSIGDAPAGLAPSDPKRIRTIIEPANEQIVSALRRTVPLFFKGQSNNFRRIGLRGLAMLAEASDIDMNQLSGPAKSFWSGLRYQG